jgi:hypothetical protein
VYGIVIEVGDDLGLNDTLTSILTSWISALIVSFDLSDSHPFYFCHTVLAILILFRYICRCGY